MIKFDSEQQLLLFLYFFKGSFYWCKALGSVNLEQAIKKIGKTTATEIKTD